MSETRQRVIITESEVRQGLGELRGRMKANSRKTYKPSDEGTMWWLVAQFHFPELLEEMFPDYEARDHDSITLVLKEGP